MATHTTSHHLPGSDMRLPEHALAADHTTGAVGGPERLLAAEEVAELLGVPRSFVYALARRHAIPAVRVGDRYVRFRATAVNQWIAEREQPARSWL